MSDGNSFLPGMSDHDFDHCNCGLGWPMGSHHNWDCPAHCICGAYGHGGMGTTKQTCCYHRGEGGRVPIGPSVMTERWDLNDLERHELPKLDSRPGSKTQGRPAGEETSGPPSLSRMRVLPE